MAAGTGAAPINTLTVQVNIMFEEMEILNKNLQKGMERWLAQDLQQRCCQSTQPWNAQAGTPGTAKH